MAATKMNSFLSNPLPLLCELCAFAGNITPDAEKAESNVSRKVCKVRKVKPKY
jgi:hypothetical protein